MSRPQSCRLFSCSRLCAALVATAAILLLGCGGGGEETTVKRTVCPPKALAETQGKRPQGTRTAWISLDRYTGPESVGILMAEERGYFDDLGLALTVINASTPEGPIGYVEEGFVDFGVAQQPQIALAKDEGASIVAVGALVPRATEAMIWLEGSKIDEVADLAGKTIAFPGLPSQRFFLEGILEEAGLTPEDVELERVGNELVPALVSGRADAIFGGFWNVEGAALEARGLEPVITRVGNLGISAYEEAVVVARANPGAGERRLISDFMSAVARGNAAAVEDPEKAVQLIEQEVGDDPAVGRKATEAGVAATLPLLSGTGCMDPAQATELVDWMREEGQVQRELPPSELLTNAYLEPAP
jgi:ABC-type nitrate/sulfonate/bicarbonate transport system substrate-binding protein